MRPIVIKGHQAGDAVRTVMYKYNAPGGKHRKIGQNVGSGPPPLGAGLAGDVFPLPCCCIMVWVLEYVCSTSVYYNEAWKRFSRDFIEASKVGQRQLTQCAGLRAQRRVRGWPSLRSFPCDRASQPTGVAESRSLSEKHRLRSRLSYSWAPRGWARWLEPSLTCAVSGRITPVGPCSLASSRRSSSRFCSP